MPAPDLAPLGVFEEQVMVAVLRTGDEAYGMSVARELERVTGREPAIGAVYATLDRLEAKRLLASVRVQGAGPTRRRFLVTRAGARVLAETHAMRERLWAGIDVRRILATAS